jgi:hypothetical protein
VDIGFITGDYAHNSLRQGLKLVRLSALGLIRSLMCFCKYNECIDDRTVLLNTVTHFEQLVKPDTNMSGGHSSQELVGII